MCIIPVHDYPLKTVSMLENNFQQFTLNNLILTPGLQKTLKPFIFKWDYQRFSHEIYERHADVEY